AQPVRPVDEALGRGHLRDVLVLPEVLHVLEAGVAHGFVPPFVMSRRWPGRRPAASNSDAEASVRIRSTMGARPRNSAARRPNLTASARTTLSAEARTTARCRLTTSRSEFQRPARSMPSTPSRA